MKLATFPQTFDNDLLKFFIGFDEQLNQMSKTKETIKNQSNYPPYNIKTLDETNYLIEIAVSGFKRNDIEIDLLDQVLTVTGKSGDDTDTGVYIFKGLATRAFTRTFTLAELVEVTDVILEDGLLKIYLEHKKPLPAKSRRLTIN